MLVTLSPCHIVIVSLCQPVIQRGLRKVKLQDFLVRPACFGLSHGSFDTQPNLMPKSMTCKFIKIATSSQLIDIAQDQIPPEPSTNQTAKLTIGDLNGSLAVSEGEVRYNPIWSAL